MMVRLLRGIAFDIISVRIGMNEHSACAQTSVAVRAQWLSVLRHRVVQQGSLYPKHVSKSGQVGTMSDAYSVQDANSTKAGTTPTSVVWSACNSRQGLVVVSFLLSATLPSQ